VMADFWQDIQDKGKEWLDDVEKKYRKKLLDPEDGDKDTTKDLSDYDVCLGEEEEEEELRGSMELVRGDDKRLFMCRVPSSEYVSLERLRKTGGPGTGIFRFELASPIEGLQHTILILTRGERGLENLVEGALRKTRSIEGEFVASFFRTGDRVSQPYSHRGMVIYFYAELVGNTYTLERRELAKEGAPIDLEEVKKYFKTVLDSVFLAYVRYTTALIVKGGFNVAVDASGDRRLQKLAEGQQAIAQWAPEQ